MNYKTPLTYKDQADYLIDKKRVEIDDLESAKISLMKCNYINLITPFKHEFAEKIPGSRFECQKSLSGKHIYLNQTDFQLYEYAYWDERSQYSNIYDGLHKFESSYKSLVTNHFLVNHNIIDSTKAIIFLDIYTNRIDNLVIHSKGSTQDKAIRKKQLHEIYEKIKKNIKGYDRKNIINPKIIEVVPPQDIYLVFDRLSLTQVNAIYFCMKPKDRLKIFLTLFDFNLTLGAKDHIDFLSRIFNVVSIRNSIMHFNSITILLKYSDFNKKIFRVRSSIEDYESIIRSLKFISKNVNLVNVT